MGARRWRCAPLAFSIQALTRFRCADGLVDPVAPLVQKNLKLFQKNRVFGFQYQLVVKARLCSGNVSFIQKNPFQVFEHTHQHVMRMRIGNPSLVKLGSIADECRIVR